MEKKSSRVRFTEDTKVCNGGYTSGKFLQKLILSSKNKYYKYGTLCVNNHGNVIYVDDENKLHHPVTLRLSAMYLSDRHILQEFTKYKVEFNIQKEILLLSQIERDKLLDKFESLLGYLSHFHRIYSSNALLLDLSGGTSTRVNSNSYYYSYLCDVYDDIQLIIEENKGVFLDYDIFSKEKKEVLKIIDSEDYNKELGITHINTLDLDTDSDSDSLF